MTGSHVLAHFQVVGQRKHTSRGDDLAVPDHNGTVVQRGAFIKDRSQHFRYHVGVELSAGMYDLFQIVFAFKDHQRAGTGIRKLFRRVAYRHNGALPLTAEGGFHLTGKQQSARPVGALAQPFKGAAQFRLEQDHRCHKSDLHDIAEDPFYGAQAEIERQRIKCQKQQNALDKLSRAGFARKQNQLIERHRNDDDIQQIPCPVE